MKTENRLGNLPPQRIAILRALQLGDMLCAVPAIRALRAALPDASITLIGLPWARSFVQRFDYYLSDFIELPGFPGFPEQPVQASSIPQFLAEMQRLGFDLVLQMQGSGSISNPLVELFGARRTAGFYLPGQYCPDPERFLPYPLEETEVMRHLRLIEFLGLTLKGSELEFPLYKPDWDEFFALQAQHRLAPDQYVCVHPGSRAEDRRWPVERFAAVADGLAGRGYQVILTGTREEAELTAAVAAQMASPFIDLASETSLGGLGALVSEARLLVCNDTGVSHLADALRTPSIVIFSASDPNRWAPQDRELHRVIAWEAAEQPRRVLDEAGQLLQKERARVA